MFDRLQAVKLDIPGEPRLGYSEYEQMQIQDFSYWITV